MDRRVFLSALSGGLLGAPLAAEAQPKPTVRRIGVVSGLAPELVEWRKEGLLRLGWVEGQNIVVEQLPLGDDSRLARELVRLNIEVLVASNNVAIAAAKAATTTIPIVMVYGDDPVRQGFVASLARPGGNITGSTGTIAPEIGEIRGKFFDFLTECRPGLSRIAVVVDPNMPSYQTFLASTKASAQSRGIAIQTVQIRETGDLAGAFAKMVKDRAQAIFIIGSPFIYGVAGQIAALAMHHRLPTAYPWRAGPEAGGLLSYGSNLRAAWHRAAVYVDRILKGANPAELPVEQPTMFEFVINLKTAKALGLTIPPSLLQRADQVIE
jgi:putative ABC transport system substrate-binding protein